MSADEGYDTEHFCHIQRDPEGISCSLEQNFPHLQTHLMIRKLLRMRVGCTCIHETLAYLSYVRRMSGEGSIGSQASLPPRVLARSVDFLYPMPL